MMIWCKNRCNLGWFIQSHRQRSSTLQFNTAHTTSDWCFI